MAVRKLSVALDEDLAAAASAAAARQGRSLSAVLSEATAGWLALEDGRAAVAEYETEFGVLTAEELRAADDTLDRLGVGHDGRDG
ncbi:hypothetical protein AB0L40_05870 [Patulibacter sp. NPDC049589]|uniref:hypothetical protein n=1 Tax=Patulibacter sp. NPDC049589 TaxID=3154731 RepID=UPI00343A3B6F